jgi:hypothetical protein
MRRFGRNGLRHDADRHMPRGRIEAPIGAAQGSARLRPVAASSRNLIFDGEAGARVVDTATSRDVQAKAEVRRNRYNRGLNWRARWAALDF